MNVFCAIVVASLAAVALPEPLVESLALLQDAHRARFTAAPTLPMPPQTVYDAKAAAAAAANVAAYLAKAAMPPQPVVDASPDPSADPCAYDVSDTATGNGAASDANSAAIAKALAAAYEADIDANCTTIPCPFNVSCATFMWDCLQSKDEAMKKASVNGGYTHVPNSCSSLKALVGICGKKYCCLDNHKAASHSACRCKVGDIAHNADCSQGVDKSLVKAICSNMATEVASGGVGATCNDTAALALMLETRTEQGHRATMQEGDEMERSLTDKCL